ncbi:MAG: 50S ribosomal protein L24e [Methanomassiliicoccales archaeon]
MVERRICSFCGNEIEPGTGKMYVKKDGTVYSFCTHKCYENMIQLRRIPRRTLWTRHARKERVEPSKEAAIAPEEAPIEEPKAEVKEAGKSEAPKEAEAEKPAKKAKKVKKAAPSEAKKKSEG